MMGDLLTKSLQAPTLRKRLDMRTPIVGLLFFAVFLIGAPSAHSEGLVHANPLTMSKSTAREYLHKETRLHVSTIRGCRRITPTHWRCRADIITDVYQEGIKVAEEPWLHSLTADIGWKGIKWHE